MPAIGDRRRLPQRPGGGECVGTAAIARDNFDLWLSFEDRLRGRRLSAGQKADRPPFEIANDRAVTLFASPCKPSIPTMISGGIGGRPATVLLVGRTLTDNHCANLGGALHIKTAWHKIRRAQRANHGADCFSKTPQNQHSNFTKNEPEPLTPLLPEDNWKLLRASEFTSNLSELTSTVAVR